MSPKTDTKKNDGQNRSIMLEFFYLCDTINNCKNLKIYMPTRNTLIGRLLDMAVTYEKLWEKLKENKMKKSELAKAAQISQYTMTKLNNDRLVSMEVMLRLCKIFHCDIGDLMEVID